MVNVENLTRIYQTGSTRQVVFDALTFSVDRGEAVALLGASGSGKTTLLNLVSGIDTPDNGRVLLDGVDVRALVEPERTLLRRRQIGFVFQFFNLIPTLKVGENVALPLELLGTDERSAQQQGLVDGIVGKVGERRMAGLGRIGGTALHIDRELEMA